MTQYLIILALLIILEIIYFRVAKHFNIVDRPSARGSSTQVTLCGGGIVFPLAALAFFVHSGFQFPWFIAGLTLVSVLSFADDVHSLSPKLRLPLQLLGMMLMLVQVLQLFPGQPLLFIVLFLVLGVVVCTGAMNIFNFMDGINGITGGYSLVVLVAMLSLLPGDSSVVRHLVIVTLLADVVFCFFNFRKRAKCFAGDVGSVSISVIILFSLIYLCFTTGTLVWFGFLVVYGIDGCLTIMHRIMLHEHLMQPHRKHMYQLMANELHIPHLVVSLIYMAAQALCCLWIMWSPSYLTLLLQVMVLAAIYVAFMLKFYHLHAQTLARQQQEKE